MKNKPLLFLLSVYGLLAISARGESPPTKVIFEQYMNQAQIFADNYPREKAYLHFDNTSYYVGDTIWFKAYVVPAEKQVFSLISRLLYAGLVDQAGCVTNRQVIKLSQGEGNGQFVFPQPMLSDYYEVRAYTCWMPAFSDPQYFPHTFPVYQFSHSDQLERSISTYELSPSMKKRPEETREKLSLCFFPEGGQLVEGITSQVVFKAESKDEGNTQLSGALYIKGGQEITFFETLHDGVGAFEHMSPALPAIAKVNFQGKQYEFALPKTLPSRYIPKVGNNTEAISVTVSCNAAALQDILAVFISHQRCPHACQLIHCQANKPQQFTVLSRKLPAGVLQISPLNCAGNTLCDRFIFASPRAPLQIPPKGLKEIYAPYAPIRYELQLNNTTGEPIPGKLSVSIRDAAHSDYMEYDNNIFTDLLFASDLKGYIHQPGYYFIESSLRRQKELDILLMVHGWRKYNMIQQIDISPLTPPQLPKNQLVLYGQVKSTIFKNKLKDIALSAMVKRDAEIITGQTVTDENGHFSIPLEDFEGSTEAAIQTRKMGEEQNEDASILIDRHFLSVMRVYGYRELHPEWSNIAHWQQEAKKFDSSCMDSIRWVDEFHLLDKVEIKSKRRSQSTNMTIKTNEQSIDAYYGIRRAVGQLRDNGKAVTTIPEVMEKLNPFFYWDRSNDNCTYRRKPICYTMDNKILSSTEVNMMLTEIDGLVSIIISRGTGGVDDEIIQNTKMFNSNDVDVSGLDKYSTFYLIPLPRHDVLNKHETAALGTRQTIMQGHTLALEYHSPAYIDKELYMDKADKRRTLYWNPTVQMDENGKAVIECYNNQYSTPLIIQAETLSSDRELGSVAYSTVAETKQYALGYLTIDGIQSVLK